MWGSKEAASAARATAPALKEASRGRSFAIDASCKMRSNRAADGDNFPLGKEDVTCK